MANQRLSLTRDQFASFLSDFEQIKQFEQLFSTTNANTISIDDVNISAGNAGESANDALARIIELSDTLNKEPMAANVSQLAVIETQLSALNVAPPASLGTVTSVAASGGTTGLTFTGSPITTSGTLTLGGTLGVANGGTNGSAAPTAGAVAYGNGTAYAFSSVGTSGQVLTSSGAGAPTWATPTTGTVTSVTGTAPVVSSGGSTPAISMAAATTSVNGYLTSTDWNTFNNKGSGSVTSVSGTGTVNGITLTGTVTSSGNLTLGGTLSGVSLTTQVSGTLPVANGGLGATTLTSGYLVKGNGTSAVSASVVYDDGTNVGIGTAVPGYKLEVAGNTYLNGVIRAAAASSAAAPGYTFAGDPDTGIYRSAANTLGISTNGLLAVLIDGNNNVGIGAAANASAILDVQSTTKGFRLPNMTTAQKNAIATPAAGLMVFDTTLAKACVYSGAAWQTITSI